jgi:DNA-binding GntR family transcriptional regulator
MFGSAVSTQEHTAMPTAHMTYVEIADDIEARIRSGEYRPHQELPSYTKLAELYSVGRTTASRAYGLLRDRRLVYGEQGRAVKVADLEPNG